MDLEFDKEEYPMLWFDTLDDGKDSGFSVSGDSSAGGLRFFVYASDIICVCGLFCIFKLSFSTFSHVLNSISSVVIQFNVYTLHLTIDLFYFILK